MDPLASDVNQGWASEPAPRANPTSPQAQQSPTSIREPRVYGDPGTALTDPASSSAGGAASREPQAPFLRIRIAGLERNRKDLLVRFDANVCTVATDILTR